MTIEFYPRQGMVLICDYDTGFSPPEMTKKRRVVIVSEDDHNKYGLCTTVPFSTTPPGSVQPFHVRFEPKRYTFLHQELPTWAKCNMINTVSAARLDRILVGGQYLSPRLEKEDLLRIYKAMLTVFGRVANSCVSN